MRRPFSSSPCHACLAVIVAQCVCHPYGQPQGREGGSCIPASSPPHYRVLHGAGTIQVCGLTKRDPSRVALPSASRPARGEAGDVDGCGTAAPRTWKTTSPGWGTISRQDYQSPSESTMHKNRKSWDKILHLPLIVMAQLFPHGDAIRLLHGCSSALVQPAPPAPDATAEVRGPGKWGPSAEQRPQIAWPPDTRKDLDLDLVFQGKPRGLSEAVGAADADVETAPQNAFSCRVTEELPGQDAGDPGKGVRRAPGSPHPPPAAKSGKEVQRAGSASLGGERRPASGTSVTVLQCIIVPASDSLWPLVLEETPETREAKESVPYLPRCPTRYAHTCIHACTRVCARTHSGTSSPGGE